jgi:hypothetical protein
MSKRIWILSITMIAILAPIKIAIGQDNSICYMEDSKAGHIDLSKICGTTAAPQILPTAAPSNNIDGPNPKSPPPPVNTNIELVPNQTQKPPIVLRDKPSPLWDQIPDLTTPLKQQPPIK